MKSSYKLIVSLVSITIGGLGNSFPVQALDVVCQSAIVDKKTHKVEFTIGFNEVPDFFSVDEFGRQADSFQYFIDVDGNLPVFGGSPYYSGVEIIICGEEIHIQSDIVLRDVEPPDTDDENSGGWGAVRGSVPYHLHHEILTFKVPLDLMGDSDGEFSYRLEWYEFGSTNGFLENKSVKGKHKKERRACFPVTETQN